jgi:short-subunit dehydrogenase
MKQPGKHVYGPWALVTGASSGIGEEFARKGAANGIHVVLLARREERLKEVAAGLTARYGVQARAVAAGLGRDGILDRVTGATGDLDIGLVVSNAGAGNPGPFISLPRERLREIVQLNVIAHLDLAHHFGQRLAKRGRGGIVLVSAVAAAGGLPYMANDSATKAYPLNLGEALHVELRPAGVHVTVLAPGAREHAGHRPHRPGQDGAAGQGHLARAVRRRGAHLAPGQPGDHSHPRRHERGIPRHEGSGYYIYDAPDLAAAIAFAARIPVARMGGTVEVRAMVER